MLAHFKRLSRLELWGGDYYADNMAALLADIGIGLFQMICIINVKINVLVC